MRVLFWSELFWPYIGGAEVFGAKLIRALSERGHEFAVVTSHDTLELPDRDTYEGVPVYRYPFRAVASGRSLKQFRQAVQGPKELKAGFQPDLIHINALGPSAVFHLRGAGDHVPTILTLQQQLLPSQTGPGTLLHQLLSTADHVVGVSDHVTEQVREMFPEIRLKSSSIPNGVDPPPVAPAPLPLDPPMLLCLGRLVPAKGLETALEAVGKLGGRFPRLQLLIAGDGPLRESLEARARELGLGESVRFLGWVEPERVYETFNLATCVLMPSLREGLPVTGVQAAMMGRPIVASAAGGLTQVVRHGETGFLVEPGDVDGFTNTLIRMLRNPEQMEAMGAAARVHALATFEWESTIEAYDRLYHEVTGGGSSTK